MPDRAFCDHRRSPGSGRRATLKAARRNRTPRLRLAGHWQIFDGNHRALHHAAARPHGARVPCRAKAEAGTPIACAPSHAGHGAPPPAPQPVCSSARFGPPAARRGRAALPPGLGCPTRWRRVNDRPLDAGRKPSRRGRAVGRGAVSVVLHEVRFAVRVRVRRWECAAPRSCRGRPVPARPGGSVLAEEGESFRCIRSLVSAFEIPLEPVVRVLLGVESLDLYETRGLIEASGLRERAVRLQS